MGDCTENFIVDVMGADNSGGYGCKAIWKLNRH